MEKYLIALDLGTSSNTASSCPSTAGELGKRAYTVPYEVHFFQKNCAQQNPTDWWEAVCTATRKIIEDIPPENVLGISFSSQMQACIAVSENGEASLSRITIWAGSEGKRSRWNRPGRTSGIRPGCSELNGHRPSASL
ncbi:MAG: FGGY family carbohydrate kinase [[Clostridium] scindens]